MIHLLFTTETEAFSEIADQQAEVRFAKRNQGKEIILRIFPGICALQNQYRNLSADLRAVGMQAGLAVPLMRTVYHPSFLHLFLEEGKKESRH